MQRVTVKLGELANRSGGRHYDVLVGPGLLDQAGALLTDAGLQGKAVIISDETVAHLYGDRLKRALTGAGFDAATVAIPPGEGQKSLETAARLYGRLTDLNAERTTPILALGGGVIGDLAGFVAATYMRGVPLVQIPTTILAQCDSSIGGKTAVNHGTLKNRIGAFYHPRLTISDVSLLQTLNRREVSDGLSEVIKHGVILDAALFQFLEEKIEQIRGLDGSLLEHAVAASARIKADIVVQDELDLGLRNVLNYGHTVGHAVETVSGLSIWHGEAVAIGMAVEARLACELGLIQNADVARIINLLERAGLKTALPALDRTSMIAALMHDKKIAGGRVKFALPQGIGKVVLTDLEDQALLDKIMDESR
jgi:3-dehydroquinate synthase